MRLSQVQSENFSDGNDQIEEENKMRKEVKNIIHQPKQLPKSKEGVTIQTTTCQEWLEKYTSPKKKSMDNQNLFTKKPKQCLPLPTKTDHTRILSNILIQQSESQASPVQPHPEYLTFDMMQKTPVQINPNSTAKQQEILIE